MVVIREGSTMIVRAPLLALAAFSAPALAAETPATPAAPQADAPVPPPTEQTDAPLPAAVQAMVDDALAHGTDAEIAAVVKYARRAYPEHSRVLAAQVVRRNTRRETERRERLARVGMFDNWHGRGEIGASRATGNVDNLGLYGALTLSHEGLSWSHQVRASANIQETGGVRTQEQLLAAYEPHYKVNDRLSAYGLLQAERDPFLGFDSRFSASAGLGYALVKRPHLTVNVQGGPAVRVEAPVTGGEEESLSGRAALDARFQLRPGVVLTQTASAFLDSRGNTLNSATGIEAQLIGRLSARLSYNVQYESQPADGLATTDTQSRVSLIYGF
jgi:putative salt-induced outer membrane protein